MKIKYKFGFMLILLMVFIYQGFADPALPPPPPSVTSVTYYLADEFTDCGSGKSIKTCDEYYLRQKVVTSAGVVTSDTQGYVCGKDNRCSVGTTCLISNPSDNSSWNYETLSNNWDCPKGKSIADMHKPGTLDPKYNSLAFSSSYPFYDNINLDLYFNAYIPACVNRIPMMNYGVELSGGGVYDQKTGLYAKHETLDYDVTPSGGVLENLYIPNQTRFRVTYNLDTELKSYRMWSFRERFVKGLKKVVNQDNLNLPIATNVDSLDYSTSHDLGDVYLSRDFMMGGHNVSNFNGTPIGSSVSSTVANVCYLDPQVLKDKGLYYIDSVEDVEEALETGWKRTQIINTINNNNLCSISPNSVESIDYTGVSSGVDENIYQKTISIDISDLKDIRGKYDNSEEFESWALDSDNLDKLSRSLRDERELSRKNPDESLYDVNSIDTFTKNENFILKVDDLDLDDVDTAENLSDYIDSLGGDYESFTNLLVDEDYLKNYELLLDINSKTVISENKLSVNGKILERDVELDVEIVSTESYDFATVKVYYTQAADTSSSWNWRSLEELTLDLLARCLYNWDVCLLNSKVEPSVPWTMNEVADLGYGPRINSMAYNASKQLIESKYNFTYGSHFDGARGSNSLSRQITVYRSCGVDEEWISDEEFYLCSNSTYYKCGYGASADEIVLDIDYAMVGDTVVISPGTGYVCANTTSGTKWRKIGCFT